MPDLADGGKEILEAMDDVAKSALCKTTKEKESPLGIYSHDSVATSLLNEGYSTKEEYIQACHKARPNTKGILGFGEFTWDDDELGRMWDEANGV